MGSVLDTFDTGGAFGTRWTSRTRPVLLIRAALPLDTGGNWNTRKVGRLDYFLEPRPLMIRGTGSWLGDLQGKGRVSILDCVSNAETQDVPCLSRVRS